MDKPLTYLMTPIAEIRYTERPNWGMCASGYTKRSGAPTGRLVRLSGETRFRRLMVWQFSNSGTCFVRIKGVEHIVRSQTMDTAVVKRVARMEAEGVTEQDLYRDPKDTCPE